MTQKNDSENENKLRIEDTYWSGNALVCPICDIMNSLFVISPKRHVCLECWKEEMDIYTKFSCFLTDIYFLIETWKDDEIEKLHDEEEARYAACDFF